MRFSVVWAFATPAYVGMAWGALNVVATLRAPGLASIAFAVLVGAFIGGALALPLVASNLAAALLTRLVARDASFAAQFRTFAGLSFVAYIAMLRWLADGLLAMGGIDLSLRGFAYQALFVLLSLALALVFMILGLRPRTVWSA